MGGGLSLSQSLSLSQIPIQSPLSSSDSSLPPMAESAPTNPSAAASSTCGSSSKQLAENDDQHLLPHRYVRTDTIYLTAPLATDIPVLDFTRLVSAMEADHLVDLRLALSSWGCFQVVNHGIEASLLEKLRELSREFFHLPMEEKQRYSRLGDDYEGYGNDPVLFENQSLDWNDRLYLLVLPQAKKKPKYWPENPKPFRDVLNEYTNKIRQIQEQLLKAMASSLSLSEDCFVKQFGEHPTMYARFNFYPPCAQPDQVLGLKPHADGSGLTVLLQDDDLEGLQVLKDEQWLRVPTVPNALLVNVGDQLEIMSNGIFKSPVHRAVTNLERERSTVVMFCSPDPAQEIEPVEELMNDARPRLFKKVRNYPETFFHYYQQGKRPIDAVRI